MTKELRRGALELILPRPDLAEHRHRIGLLHTQALADFG
jgi:hypothetical protein